MAARRGHCRLQHPGILQMLLLPGVVLDNVHVLENQHSLLALQTELGFSGHSEVGPAISSSQLARLVTADDRDSQTCLGHALEQSRAMSSHVCMKTSFQLSRSMSHVLHDHTHMIILK